jgi:hypothetical protein
MEISLVQKNGGAGSLLVDNLISWNGQSYRGLPLDLDSYPRLKSIREEILLHIKRLELP